VSFSQAKIAAKKWGKWGMENLGKWENHRRNI